MFVFVSFLLFFLKDMLMRTCYLSGMPKHQVSMEVEYHQQYSVQRDSRIPMLYNCRVKEYFVNLHQSPQSSCSLKRWCGKLCMPSANEAGLSRFCARQYTKYRWTCFNTISDSSLWCNFTPHSRFPRERFP